MDKLLHRVEITDLIESIIREVPIHEDTISTAYISSKDFLVQTLYSFGGH